ncbi:hypothetical protein QNI16_00800 [Cytophagaceae bacterium YF14B1]|uniref:Uncharacterized protein n=2 Tax=Bacteria TaxID=2 RepID=A0AAE3U4Y9_9BACT|nr:hypothetical protein [Xanthocytophaga flavus]MDJ1478997.1 hypothetical protein [Xanthocytophaga flavus]
MKIPLKILFWALGVFIGLLILILLFIEKSNKPQIVINTPNQSKFTIQDSILFDLSIDKIVIDTVKAQFYRSKAEMVPDTLIGNKLTVYFSISNPYDKAYDVTVAEVYGITSCAINDFTSVYGGIPHYDRLGIPYFPSSKVLDSQGKESWKWKYSQGHLVPFEAKQTRSFHFSFKPIAREVETVEIYQIGTWNIRNATGKTKFIWFTIDMNKGKVIKKHLLDYDINDDTEACQLINQP